MLPKSVDMIVAAVAVVKAGGGYLPLDRAHPRRAFGIRVEDAQPVCVISDSTFPNSAFPNSDVVVVGGSNPTNTPVRVWKPMSARADTEPTIWRT